MVGQRLAGASGGSVAASADGTAGAPYSRPVPTATVHRTLTGTWRVLVKELGAFGAVGLFCFVLDLGLFQLLYAEVGIGAVTAKLLATLVSMTAAFVGHRYWSFSHRAQTGLRQGYVRFAVINGATLALGLAVVATARYGLDLESPLALQVANVASIGLGTALRWLGYRRWVFLAPPDQVRTADAPLSS
jgi:putative flippase GtrA